MFELTNVKYRTILNIEHLIIPTEKITCIVGESGSGKTTLLRLLNNLISCDEGIITFQEESVNEVNPTDLRRRVVMLPQSPVIFPGPVRDNLLTGLKFAEKPLVDEETLTKILKFVALDKRLDGHATELSGGEKQRLALARVLLMDPEVFLLDEPSSALDEGTEEMIIGKLVAHTKEHRKSLIMVTHSKKIARMYGEFIVTLHQGKIAVPEGE